MGDFASIVPDTHCSIMGEDDVEQGRRIEDDSGAEEPFLTLSLHDDSSRFHGYITFRPLQASDRDQVQELHEEWFPVRYKEEFYDHLVLQRMVNTGEKLFTRAAVYHEPSSQWSDGEAQFPEDVSSFPPQQESNSHNADVQTPVELASFPPHQPPLHSSSTIDEDDKESDNEDLIVACIVGSLLDASRMDKDTASWLISNPSKYTRVFYIMTLGTLTEFRNARLATTLVEMCIRLVQNDPQCGALYLHVITFNAAAIRFYERLGFYRVTEIENYYRIDGKLYNCYVYARYFNGNRGHWDVYYVVAKVVSSVWHRFTKPFSMITNPR